MMSNRVLFSLAFVLFCFNACATQMVKIAKWQDVTPFSNKIVAYLTNSSYYGSKDGYAMNNNTFLKYSLINKCANNLQGKEDGHTMYQLLRPNEVWAAPKALVDSKLKKAHLYMRLVDLDEIKKILEAVKTDKAIFEYWSRNKAMIIDLLETRERE